MKRLLTWYLWFWGHYFDNAVVCVNMKRLLRWSSWFRPHYFDIAGVVGLSLSANVLASFYGKRPDCGYIVATCAVLVWGVFGGLMMLCSVRRRPLEERYIRERAKPGFVEEEHEYIFATYVHNGELLDQGKKHCILLHYAAVSFFGGLLTVLWPHIDMLCQSAIFCQILANAISGGAACFLVALGIWLVSRSLGFLNITHGAFYLLGAYWAIALERLGWFPWPLGFFLAVVFAVSIGLAYHLLVFFSLQRRQASPLVLLLASLGAYVVAVNAISLVFGDSVIAVRDYTIKVGCPVLSAKVTPVQVALVSCAVVLVVAIEFWLRSTKWGLRFRAFSDSPDLFAETGGQSTALIMLIFCLAGTGAAVAGILNARDAGATPTMAMAPLLMGAVSATICGTRGPAWLLIISIFITYIQQLSSWFLGLQWRDPITFAVLLVFLITVRSKSRFTQQPLAR